MSKLVTLSRNYGEFLTRFDEKFVETGDQTPQVETIIVPDRRAALMKRIGKYIVEDIDEPKDVFNAFDVDIVASANMPAGDPNHDAMVHNQTEASCLKVDDTTYRIMASGKDLISFESSNPAQGSHKWVGIEILTDEDTIVGIEVDGYVLTDVDVTESESVKLPNGGIVFWFKFEQGSKTLVFKYLGKYTKLTIEAFDTSI